MDRNIENITEDLMMRYVEGDLDSVEYRKIIVSQAKEMEKEGAFNLADMMGGGEMIE